MPFCPICKREYETAVKECPTDHAPLVGELPFQVVSGDTTTWVEIASVGTEEEAKLLQGFLDAEGIPAQIENLQFRMEPTNFGLMGDIRVYVESEDEARAVTLLRERDRAYDNLDDDEETLVTDEGPAAIDETAKAEVEE
jgi:putative signal transducing protein